MNYLLGVVLICYLLYTLRYTISYVKFDSHFSRRQKIAHGILIWLLPFVWIRILKVVLKPREYIFPKDYKPAGSIEESSLTDV